MTTIIGDDDSDDNGAAAEDNNDGIYMYIFVGYNPEVRPDITQEFRTASNWKFSLMPAAVWTLK